MDIDALSAARSEDWQRLRALANRSRHTGPEADELIDRYQAGASDLSAIRTSLGLSSQGDELSIALSRARLRFTGAPANVLARITIFFSAQLPAALYRVRWLTIWVFLGTTVIATAVAMWLNSDPKLLLGFGTPADLRHYANSEFVGYYSAHPDPAFAGQVWTNNAWVAAQLIAFGITGIYPIAALVTNGVNLGVSEAVMAQYGRLDHFFLYIAPHGQLELYSVFTAGATGLMLFWSWISPGSRTRVQALADAGRSFFTIVVGLALSLLVSGIIEGFVTRQDWPWPIKIGIGTVALAAFLFYQWFVGRRASRGGETGDLEEFEAGARELVAD